LIINCTSQELRLEANNYEDKKPAKENRTIRETVARRSEEACEAKTEIAGGRGRKGDESQKEIGCSRYRVFSVKCRENTE
jgi:hypothetical protein